LIYKLANLLQLECH